MKVITESLIEGARKAKGLVVIIDVFRAFTTAAYVMNNGAKRIIPVSTLEEAFELKKRNPDFILIGERNGLKVEGFDYGNSPAEIQNVDFTDKTLLQTTSAGTRGILNVRYADEILLGNFVNIQSTIDYIGGLNPEILTLVPLGTSGVEKSDEDELCAGYIKDSLEGKKPDFNEIKTYLRTYKSALKFFDRNTKYVSEQLCCPKNSFGIFGPNQPSADSGSDICRRGIASPPHCELIRDQRSRSYETLKSFVLKFCNAKFSDKSRPEFQEDDFHCAMAIDKFGFVLKVKKDDNHVYIVREF